MASDSPAVPRPVIRESGILRCPACLAPGFAAQAPLRCGACGHEARAIDGVLDLRLDAAQDTMLELDSYDARHGVSPDNAAALFKVYDESIRTLSARPRERILEIGAGTGNLTAALCTISGFAEVHCSDISPRFMTRLHAKLTAAEGGTALHSYLFDANALPFIDASFDVVVGHSVLHHLANFEATIRDAGRVLQPGGLAIFGEPVMEFHALAFLAADLVVRIDAARAEPVLSPRSRAALSAISRRGALKARNLLERSADVERFEDKFIFPSGYMRDLSRDAGFARFELIQSHPLKNLGALIEHKLAAELNSSGANGEDLVAFRPFLAAFTDSYQPAMRPFLSQPFAYCVFIKG